MVANGTENVGTIYLVGFTLEEAKKDDWHLTFASADDEARARYDFDREDEDHDGFPNVYRAQAVLDMSTLEEV